MISRRQCNFPFREGQHEGSKKAGSRGVAYLAVLILVLILTLMGLAFLKTTELRTHETQEALRREQARLAAEAALEKVRWALRRLPLLTSTGHSDLNPFDSTWCSDAFRCVSCAPLALLMNPQEGEEFYPEARKPYYRIVDIKAQGTKVRVRVFGSLDTDGDGREGVLDRDGDGKIDFGDADPEDTNFFLEAHLGLPGSLGNDLILAAKGIKDPQGREISLQRSTESLFLAKAIGSEGFFYDTMAGDSAYGTVLSGRVSLGEPSLPHGLFDEGGLPSEAYFEGIPTKRLTGPIELRSSPDPTLDLPPGGILWVEGDVTIRELDLEENWSRKDIVVIATGKISLDKVRCGWKGRLVLIAPQVEISGKGGDWLNAIVVARRDLTLRSEAEGLVSCSGSASCGAIYLFGSLLAGDNLNLASSGWALVFDPLVLNGSMGWSPGTFILDRFEDQGLGSWWRYSGGEMAQGRYLQDEIKNGAGDSADLGGDSAPQVLRFTIKPTPGNAMPENTLVLNLKDCPGCTRDFAPYSEIHFQMAMDSYRREELSQDQILETRREARVKLSAKDEDGRELWHFLASPGMTCTDGDADKYCPSLFGKDRYKFQDQDVADPDSTKDDYGDATLPRWKRLKVKFRSMEGDLANFDLRRVSELILKIEDWIIIWERNGLTRRLEPQGSAIKFYPEGGCPIGSDCSVIVGSEGKLQWENPEHEFLDIPCTAPGDCWGVPPLRLEDLPITIRLDRLELPGATVMKHGLPAAFALEPHLWRELGEKEMHP